MMTLQQTKAEFQHQLQGLMAASSIDEQKRLEKYVKPFAKPIPTEDVCKNDSTHISQILPGVMENIEQKNRRAK